MWRRLKLPIGLLALSLAGCGKENAPPEVSSADPPQATAVAAQVVERGTCRDQFAAARPGNWAWTGRARDGAHASIVHFSGRRFALLWIRPVSAGNTESIVVHPDEAEVFWPQRVGMTAAEARRQGQTPQGRDFLALVRAARARCGVGTPGS